MVPTLFLLMVGALPQSTLELPQSTLPPSRKLTYDEAYAQAIASGKPLVCWVGNGDVVCPACVKTMQDEAIHCLVPSLPGIPAKAIVVGMPDGRGGLTRTATITEWITGSEVWGHVPSVRRAIRNWSATRHVILSGWSLDPIVAPVGMAPRMWPTYRPMMGGRRGGG